MGHVSIIAKERLWADAISTMLGHPADVTVVNPETGIEQALNLITEPETVVIAFDTDNHVCYEFAQEIGQRYPGVAMVVVGIPDHPKLILSYLEAGCVGYVRLSDSLHRLREILRAQREQRIIVDPHIASAMLERLNELQYLARSVPGQGGDGNHDGDLTGREHEVLQLVAKGMTNQQIADELYIEIGTAKNHVHRILRKLDVRDRREAGQYLDATRAHYGVNADGPPEDQVAPLPIHHPAPAHASRASAE